MAPTMLTPLLIGISNWLLPLQAWLFLVRLLHEVFSSSMSRFWKACTGLILFFCNYNKYALELPTWSVQFPFLLTNQSTARGLLWSTAWAWMSKPYFDCRINIFWVSLFVCMYDIKFLSACCCSDSQYSWTISDNFNCSILSWGASNNACG